MDLGKVFITGDQTNAFVSNKSFSFYNMYFDWKRVKGLFLPLIASLMSYGFGLFKGFGDVFENGFKWFLSLMGSCVR